MNKKISTFIVFLIFLISFLYAENYYRSNSIGLVYEQVPFYRIDEFDWIIEIKKEESIEIRKIYFEGEIIKSIEFAENNNNLTIKEYQGDKLIRIEQKKNDLVIKEEFYEENLLISEYFYEWSDRKLQKTTCYEQSVLIYEDTFVLGEKGRILQIRRLFEDNKLKTSGFSDSQKRNSFEWYGSENDFALYNYHDGKVVRIENWKDGVLNRKRIFTFSETGHTIVETDLLIGQINVKEFDLNDNILIEKISTGNIVQKIIYIYDNDQLIQKNIASSGKRIKYLYEYNNESSLILERIVKDNMLIKEIFYDHGKKILEKMYKDNSLLLEIAYINGEKVSEEYIK